MTRAINRNIVPAIPFIQLCDYNGGQIITNAGMFHTWDTQSFKTSNFIYTLDSNKVFLAKHGAGYYEIIFECSFSTNEYDDLEIYTQIYKNDIVIDNSKTILSVAAVSQIPTHLNCQTLHYILFLEKGDYVQIKSTSGAGPASTFAKTSRLIIKFIPMEGWNNSQAGREEIKGGVLR